MFHVAMVRGREVPGSSGRGNEVGGWLVGGGLVGWVIGFCGLPEGGAWVDDGLEGAGSVGASGWGGGGRKSVILV